MKVVIFGATGMVGQGVLREALLAPDVERVVTVGRRATGQRHAKLEELEVPDPGELSSVESRLAGFDAGFFCLGVTSAGMGEAAYAKVTVDIAAGAGATLARVAPGMTFVFVSGAGADASGTSRTMWARVKGRAENAVLALPFRAAYVFRPAFIQPLDGIRSRTAMYNALYAVLRPLTPLVRRFAPGSATTTRRMGRAMLEAVRTGYHKRVLETADINALAGPDAR